MIQKMLEESVEFARAHIHINPMINAEAIAASGICVERTRSTHEEFLGLHLFSGNVFYK